VNVIRRVGLAALVVVLGASAALDLKLWLTDLWLGHSGGDFAGYYVAARVGWSHGWAGIYEGDLYPAAQQALIASRGVFGNLPFAAWAALPLAALPFHLADVLWSLLLAALFLATWLAVTRTNALSWEHVLLLLSALVAFPVLFAFHAANLVLVVAALLALHWRLLRSGHPVLAGVALGLAFIKPQDVVLLPLVLLLSGRWKTAAACGAVAAVLATALVLALGGDGLRALHSTLGVSLACQFCARQTLAAHLPGWVPALPVRAAVVVVALVPALLAGARRPEPALMAGLLGAFLVTPYLNVEDLTLLFVGAWLVLRAGAPDWIRLALVVAYPFVAFENVMGPAPLLLAELALLLVFVGSALESAGWPIQLQPAVDAGEARLAPTRPGQDGFTEA